MNQINIINTVDNSLEKLLLPKRIEYYKKLKKLYSNKMKSNQPPGFESVLSAFLFCDLHQIYKDNVFLEWPVSMGKIDVRVYTQGQGFIYELKMYYAKDEKSYENDFSKLYQEVKNDSHTIAVHAHAQIYPNSNFPAHNYLMKKEKELASKNGYWQNYKEIGHRNDIHIARLIFSKK